MCVYVCMIIWLPNGLVWQSDTSISGAADRIANQPLSTDTIAYLYRLLTQMSKQISVANQPIATSTANFTGDITYNQDTSEYCIDALDLYVDSVDDYYLQAVVAGVVSNTIPLEPSVTKACNYNLGAMSLCDLNSMLTFIGCVFLFYITVAKHSILVEGALQCGLLVMFFFLTMASLNNSSGDQRKLLWGQLIMLIAIGALSIMIFVRGVFTAR